MVNDKYFKSAETQEITFAVARLLKAWGVRYKPSYVGEKAKRGSDGSKYTVDCFVLTLSRTIDRLHYWSW
jgi:hypothetical protein